MLQMLSLFSGIGGIDLAAQWAGITTVAFSEIDPYCQAVLRRHWPQVPQLGDIRDVTVNALAERGLLPIDLVAGGFPCQPFSEAGQKQGTADRRHLWPEMRRVIGATRPRWVLAENVPGLVRIALDDVLTDLEDLGYATGTILLPACAVGAPHKRERVFIVAHALCGRCQRLAATARGDEHDGPQTGWEESPGRLEYRRALLGDPQSQGLSQQQRSDAPAPAAQGAHHLDQRSQRSDAERRDAFESLLGGMFDGVSTRLDGYQWPAGRGDPAYAWEPPRTVMPKSVAHRIDRVKALGNAVVPQQIFPLLAGIVALSQEGYSCCAA